MYVTSGNEAKSVYGEVGGETSQTLQMMWAAWPGQWREATGGTGGRRHLVDNHVIIRNSFRPQMGGTRHSSLLITVALFDVHVARSKIPTYSSQGAAFSLALSVGPGTEMSLYSSHGATKSVGPGTEMSTPFPRSG